MPLVRLPWIALACALLAPAAWAEDQPAAADPSAQTWDQAQSAMCTAGIRAAEEKHGTAPGLAGAIAKAESGRPIPPLPGLQPWPWAVNADGAAMYFQSRAAAVTWTRLALARGVRQVDVGCMQVNLQSHPAAFRDLDEAFDPAANTDYGARFLRQLRDDANGNWYEAVGYYHSRTPVLASDYRARVAAIAAGRVPPPSLGVPLYMRAIRQGSLRINIRRQPSLRGPRRLSACQVVAVLGSYVAARARARCVTERG